MCLLEYIFYFLKENINNIDLLYGSLIYLEVRSCFEVPTYFCLRFPQFWLAYWLQRQADVAVLDICFFFLLFTFWLIDVAQVALSRQKLHL